MINFDFCRTILLSVGVLEAACTGHIANCRHLLLSSKATALIDLSLQLLTDALPPKEPPQGVGAVMGGTFTPSKATPLCGPLLSLLASMISTLTSGPLREDSTLLPHLLDIIGWVLHSTLHYTPQCLHSGKGSFSMVQNFADLASDFWITNFVCFLELCILLVKSRWCPSANQTSRLIFTFPVWSFPVESC